MRGITLTQPWATLVAVNEKTVETRSWRTSYRGLLAIHAGIGLEPVGGMRGLIETVEREPFASTLAPHVSGYTPEERARDLPRGAIVAIVELLDVIPTERFAPVLMEKLGSEWVEMFEREAPFGDYRPGRYAWVLRHRLNLHDGIECKGAQGVWKLPKATLDRLSADLGALS